MRFELQTFSENESYLLIEFRQENRIYRCSTTLDGSELEIIDCGGNVCDNSMFTKQVWSEIIFVMQFVQKHQQHEMKPHIKLLRRIENWLIKIGFD